MKIKWKNYNKIIKIIYGMLNKYKLINKKILKKLNNKVKKWLNN